MVLNINNRLCRWQHTVLYMVQVTVIRNTQRMWVVIGARVKSFKLLSDTLDISEATIRLEIKPLNQDQPQISDDKMVSFKFGIFTLFD